MNAESALFSQVVSRLMEDIHERVSAHDLQVFRDQGPENWPFDDRASVVVAALAQLNGISKKFLGASERDDSRLRATRAIELFVSMNNHCRETNQRLSAKLTPEVEHVLDEATWLIWNKLNANRDGVPISAIISQARMGPGASRGVDSTDFYTKVCNGPLTYSNEFVRSLYQYMVKTHALWSESETIRAHLHGHGDKRLLPKITTVPKTDVIDRTIMVEPSLDMFFQLGTGRILERILEKRFGIDLASQPELNREMARIGSTNRSDFGFRWCTIDLKSASDTISKALVKRLLPPEWFTWLSTIRSCDCLLPNGDNISLEMMSTMGNGFTFPLQTMIFASLVTVCYENLGLSLRLPDGRKSFGVFGDDIIVDERAYDYVVHILTSCGFIVNNDKSFNFGPFRESCGTDWYLGRNVRPVYCRNLRTTQERISLINRLNRWSALWNIPLKRTIRLLYQSIPRKSRLVVPNYESDDAGIHVGLSTALNLRDCGFPIRESSHLMRRLGAQPGSIIYQLHEAKPSSLAMWRWQTCDGKKVLVETKTGVNAPGLLLCALQGSLRGRRISIRMDKIRYRNTYGICPGWGDPSVLGGAKAHWAGSYAYWEVSTERNLLGK